MFNRDRRARKPYKGPAMEGAIAAWYARITKGELRAYRECAAAVAERAPEGARVLELAPGPGYLALELARLGRFRVFGLDISRSFVRMAAENARAAGLGVEFRHGNASAMPYPDACFDFVVCRAAFKNFAEPVAALDEIHRVLRPGGQASIFDLRRDASAEEIAAEVARMKLSGPNALATRLIFRFFLLRNAYARDELARMAAASRFGKGEVRESGVSFELRLCRE